jgi:hypothetical protein
VAQIRAKADVCRDGIAHQGRGRGNGSGQAHGGTDRMDGRRFSPAARDGGCACTCPQKMYFL